MKFSYQYRTRDNEPRAGSIRAATRDAAYAALKGRGIRPVKVEPTPGFFNWLCGPGKWVLAFVGLAAVAGVFVLKTLMRSENAGEELTAARAQIYADSETLQRYAASGWAEAFADEGDRIFAAYAIPGRTVSKPERRPLSTAFVTIGADDPEEIRKMKRMVNWMKEELGEYLAAGGTEDGYYERLDERQRMEAAIVRQAEREINRLRLQAERNGDVHAVIGVWRAKNELLREMGLKTFPLPDEWLIE